MIPSLKPGGDRIDKCSYRPVSILSTLSKIFENLLLDQMKCFVDSKLSKFQCGFRTGFSAQYCLITMIEKLRMSIDKKMSSGIRLTDLSKAFDCLVHDLLIAKLNAYGFNLKSLHLINNYPTSRYQRVRIGCNYSSWSKIINGVPQGSILGPILFNIYLSDLFFITATLNIASYADDNSPYTTMKDTDSVIKKLEEDSEILLNLGGNNALKPNPEKFHLLLNCTDETKYIEVDNHQIYNSPHEKLLGIYIDNNMTFDEHVTRLCNKASHKLHALERVSSYMNTQQRRKIMTAYLNSKFGCCPLVWMFHSRTLNNRINKIHEKSLRIVYNDNNLTYEELLWKDNSFTVHERNIQALAIEMYKMCNNLSPDTMKLVIPLKGTSQYCSRFPFKTRNVNTLRYGTETISFLGPKIWSIIPNEFKRSTSIIDFKCKIRKWKPVSCPCRLCKPDIAGVGFC